MIWFLTWLFSISHWNEAGQPRRPIGDVIHSNCPLSGIVKAVRWESSGCIGICQNPEVRSRVEKIVDPAWPLSPMHSLISFIEYLLICKCWLSSRKSCMIQSPAPLFLGTQKIVNCTLKMRDAQHPVLAIQQFLWLENHGVILEFWIIYDTLGCRPWGEFCDESFWLCPNHVFQCWLQINV